MNGNAFMARLVHLKDAPDYIEIYALAALRWGLEGGEFINYNILYRTLRSPYHNQFLIEKYTINPNVGRPEYRKLRLECPRSSHVDALRR